MSATYKSPGITRRYANATGSTITAGTMVALRTGSAGETGIAVEDIANNATGVVYVAGVHEVAKATGAISAHALVYKNATPAITTTSSTTFSLAGVCVEAATTAATTVKILLNGRTGSALSD